MSLELIEKEVSKLTKLESEIIIRNEQDCDRAGIVLKNIKEMMKKVSETFDPICDKAYKTWKEATGQREKYLTPLKRCEVAFKNRIAGYLEEQDRIRQKLQAEAEKKARKESENLQAKAEKQEAKGNIEKAEELRQEAQIKSALVPEIPQAKKPEGMTIRKIWKCKIIDKNLVPEEFKIVDESAINKVLQGTNGTMKIPGVQAYQENIVSQTTKKAWDE